MSLIGLGDRHCESMGPEALAGVPLAPALRQRVGGSVGCCCVGCMGIGGQGGGLSFILP